MRPRRHGQLQGHLEMGKKQGSCVVSRVGDVSGIAEVARAQGEAHVLMAGNIPDRAQGS